MGLVRQGLGQFERAASLHQLALALKARHPVVRAIILNNVGNAQLGLRQLDVAFTSFEEALAIYRRLEDRAGEGTVLNNLGADWEIRSDLAKACHAYAQALAASAGADDRSGQAVTRRHIERLVERAAAGDSSVETCRIALWRE